MPLPPLRRTSAFSLVELLVMILILAALAGALVPRVSDRRAVARDSQRLSDLRVLRSAIEQYYQDRGTYPPSAGEAQSDGWDVSSDGRFIPELFKTGYLREPRLDPINDARHAYAYQVFPEGSFGFEGKGKFYVLGIKKFETPTFSDEHPGHFRSPTKDWSEDFEFATGPAVEAMQAKPRSQ